MMFDDIKSKLSANDSDGFFDDISKTITETLITVGIRVTCLSFMFSPREKEKINPESNEAHEANEEESECLMKCSQHVGS